MSPGSRGKGSRRLPGRDGGRRKSKALAWRKQATRAVDDASALIGDFSTLDYHCPIGRTASEAIYLFDQEIARTGIRYHAELAGSRLWPIFTIRVPLEREATVKTIIALTKKR